MAQWDGKSGGDRLLWQVIKTPAKDPMSFLFSRISPVSWSKPLQTRLIKILGTVLFLLLCFLAVLEYRVVTTPLPPAQAPVRISPPNVLILYDMEKGKNVSGRIYAVELANLLGHFEVKATLQPVINYQAGTLEAYDATFYIGSLYDMTLPPAFLDDILKTQKTIGWMGYNLKQLFKHKPKGATPVARQRYGFEISKFGSFLPGPMDVNYRGGQFFLSRASYRPGPDCHSRSGALQSCRHGFVQGEIPTLFGSIRILLGHDGDSIPLQLCLRPQPGPCRRPA